MCPVFTPAYPPPHPSIISPYSKDAQVVLGALKAKYGIGIKAEVVPTVADTGSPFCPPPGYLSRRSQHQPFIKQEPPTPTKQDRPADVQKSRESLVPDHTMGCAADVPPRFEILSTQKHTTLPHDSFEMDDDDVQILFQEGPKVSCLEQGKYSNDRFKNSETKLWNGYSNLFSNDGTPHEHKEYSEFKSESCVFGIEKSFNYLTQLGPRDESDILSRRVVPVSDPNSALHLNHALGAPTPQDVSTPEENVTTNWDQNHSDQFFDVPKLRGKMTGQAAGIDSSGEKNFKFVQERFSADTAFFNFKPQSACFAVPSHFRPDEQTDSADKSELEKGQIIQVHSQDLFLDMSQCASRSQDVEEDAIQIRDQMDLNLCGHVEVNSAGQMNSCGSRELNYEGSVDVNSGEHVEMNSCGSRKLNSGEPVEANPRGNMEMDSFAQIELNSSGLQDFPRRSNSGVIVIDSQHDGCLEKPLSFEGVEKVRKESMSVLKSKLEMLKKRDLMAQNSATSDLNVCKKQKLVSADKDLDDMEKLLEKKHAAQPKKKSFKVPFRGGNSETSRQTKITEVINQGQSTPLAGQNSGRPFYIDVGRLSTEKLTKVKHGIQKATEISLTLAYSNDGTLLREKQVEKKRGSKNDEQIQVSGLFFQINPGDKGSVFFIPFVSTPSGESSEVKISREVVTCLMESSAHKVCFSAQECVRSVIAHFSPSDKEVITKLIMLDPKVGLWLTDPDNPPGSFPEVLKKMGLEQKESGTVQDDLEDLSAVMKLLHKRLTSEGQWALFHRLETRLIPILSLMELRGIRVKPETLLHFGELLKKKISKVEAAAFKCAGHSFQINSHPQLRQVLFEELKLDSKLPTKAKIARTSVNHQKSTSEAVLNQLSQVHPLPGIILEYRQFQKLKSTYVDGMLVYVKDGYLHTTWDHTAAATGRLTSTNPNVQAIPKQPVELIEVEESFIAGREDAPVTLYIRDPFISQEGCSLMAADFQQIELRLLAHLANDPQLVQVFNDPDCKDIFIELTKQWLGKAYDKVTTSDREQTKRVVYSVMYGVGKERLAEYLKMTPDNAKAIMQSFLVKFPGVKAFTQQAVDTCRKKGYTQTIFKRRRLIPNIRHKSPVLRSQAERQAVNFCVQGSAADICKAAMIQVEHTLAEKSHLQARVLIQIHDEILLEVPDDQIQDVKDILLSIMESTEGLCGDMVKLKVPLRVSLSCGKAWGHMENV